MLVSILILSSHLQTASGGIADNIPENRDTLYKCKIAQEYMGVSSWITIEEDRDMEDEVVRSLIAANTHIYFPVQAQAVLQLLQFLA